MHMTLINAPVRGLASSYTLHKSQLTTHEY